MSFENKLEKLKKKSGLLFNPVIVPGWREIKSPKKSKRALYAKGEYGAWGDIYRQTSCDMTVPA